jgi:Reverse transcriptase (RNA-dependent DNA polymerase)
MKLLFVTEAGLNQILACEQNYRPIEKKKSDGSIRMVYAPSPPLKRIQKRLSELLMRVAVPDYLMCPVKGRSNIDNANVHRGSRAKRLLDIQSFYPNCSANKVAEFFVKKVMCSPDVAKILVCLATRDGALPQGSPCSPILAFWSYHQMWEDIAKVTSTASCKFSIWVDDLAISGSFVSAKALFEIKGIIQFHGHQVHPEKQSSTIDSPTTITGVVVAGDSLRLPNRLHRARQLKKVAMQREKAGVVVATLQASVFGLDQFEKEIAKRNLC